MAEVNHVKQQKNMANNRKIWKDDGDSRQCQQIFETIDINFGVPIDITIAKAMEFINQQLQLRFET